MSASEKFAIELPDGGSLSKGDLVEHTEYGPMHVDEIRVGPHQKRVTLSSELGPEALQLSGDDIREQWGETLHCDPAELYDGKTRYTHEDISIDGVDITATVTIEGQPEAAAQAVDARTVDAVVRAMEAVRDHVYPADCQGVMEIDWDGVFEDLDDSRTTLDEYDTEGDDAE